jgi:hypothetical protein
MNQNFPQHLYENGNRLCKNDEIMDILHLGNKGRHLNTMDKYYINLDNKTNNQINDRRKVNKSSIFNTVVQYDHKAGQHL